MYRNCRIDYIIKISRKILTCGQSDHKYQKITGTGSPQRRFRVKAEGFPIPKDLVWRMRDGDLILDIHPDVLEKFVDVFRGEGLGKEQEMAFQIADRYIHLQESEEGYDYSILDTDYKLLDGGVYEDFDIGIREALDAIVDELKEGAFASGEL